MNTENQKIAGALMSLRPGAEWILTGNDLANLNWLDKHSQRPTDKEIADEMSRIDAIKPTIADKLEQVGLSLDDLKLALGIK